MISSRSGTATDSRVTYALQILCNGEGAESLPIIYGSVNEAARTAPAIYIIPSGFFDETAYGSATSLPSFPLRNIDGVPLLFGKPTIERCGSALVVRADIIASTYFLTTRYEEIVRRDVRDQHGRFPGRESLPCRAGFIHRPIVDEYARLLRKWLREVGIRIQEPPQGVRKTYLTHDVDIPWRWPQLTSVLRGTLRNIIRVPRKLFDPMLCYAGLRRDPEDCFDWILHQDRAVQQSLGSDKVESVFFLMAGGRTSYDGQYDIRSRRTKGLIRRLVDSGASVGLHASYEAGLNPASVSKEAEALREATCLAITQNRYHYLACREPEDVRQLEQAGITDDFSFGYADVAGFRLGTCRPVRWFDPVECRLTDLTLHPLTVMDCTLHLERYMNLNYEAARHLCFSLFDQVKKHSGELTLLWHNTELTEEKRHHGSYQPQLYQDVLHWIRNNS